MIHVDGVDRSNAEMGHRLTLGESAYQPDASGSTLPNFLRWSTPATSSSLGTRLELYLVTIPTLRRMTTFGQFDSPTTAYLNYTRVPILNRTSLVRASFLETGTVPHGGRVFFGA